MCHKAQEYHLTNRYGKETEMITELHVALLPRSVCSQHGANEQVNKSVQAGDHQSGLVITSSSTMAAGMHSNEAWGTKE